MDKKLTAIIADDEKNICASLKRMLQDNLEVEVIAVCHDGDTAKEIITEKNPDIAFLDIRMPGLSGIDVALAIEAMDDPPMVVFITAYDEYAIKAFEVKALDYILKPFSVDSLSRVIDKLNRIVTKSVEVKSAENDAKTLNRNIPTRFCMSKDERSVIVDTDEILLVYAENRGVFIRTLDGAIYTSKMTIKEFEEILDPNAFFRCHRNFIVNIRQVKEISPGFNRGYILTLKGAGKVEAPVSRSNINRLAKYIVF